MTPGTDPPKEMEGKDAAVLAFLVIVVGGLLFAAFSFITFGVPLVVVAVAGLIWVYVGIMRWVDRAFTKRAEHPPGNSESR